MKIEIIKSDHNNPVAEFFSSSSTPETDAVCEDIGMGCMMVASDFARKLECERDEARDVLSEIALYLSVGMGDKTTTAQQYYERILEGIKMLTDPLQDRIRTLEEMLDMQTKIVVDLEMRLIKNESRIN